MTFRQITGVVYVVLCSRLLVVAVYFFIGFLLERFARVTERSSEGNRFFNYGNTMIFHVFDVLIGLLIAVQVASIVAAVHGRLHLFESHPGLPFAVVLAVLISMFGDFGEYWWHRAQHRFKWLWPIHELHHSDECMNVTTTFRFHWLESPVRNCLGLIPAVFLPAPQTTIPLYFLIGCANIFFVHTNTRISFGWFNRIVACPHTHRIHHSKLPKHFDKNFASVWPFWDVLFGTYYHPEPDEFPPTGLAEGVAETSVTRAAFAPFRAWARMIAPRQENSAPIAPDRSFREERIEDRSAPI